MHRGSFFSSSCVFFAFVSFCTSYVFYNGQGNIAHTRRHTHTQQQQGQMENSEQRQEPFSSQTEFVAESSQDEGNASDDGGDPEYTPAADIVNNDFQQAGGNDDL